PRVVFVNKMDKVGADFEYSVGTIRDRLQANAHPIQFPIGAEDNFTGIIDLVDMKAYNYGNDLGTEIEEIEIPEEYKDKADELRESLIEGLADVNEDIMEKYLGGEEIARDELMAAIRQATCDVEFYPVMCGTAFKNKGVQLLLNAVIDHCIEKQLYPFILECRTTHNRIEFNITCSLADCCHQLISGD